MTADVREMKRDKIICENLRLNVYASLHLMRSERADVGAATAGASPSGSGEAA